jgi:hypothetical protein
MTDVKTDAASSLKPPYFKVNLRLSSDSEPLMPLVCTSERNWPNVDVKGQTIPAKGRVSSRIATQHYAASADEKHSNLSDIESVVNQWLCDVEQDAPPVSALATAGKVDAILWIAIFGNDEIPTPLLSAELCKRAKQAGIKILIENYTVTDGESGNAARSFFGAED